MTVILLGTILLVLGLSGMCVKFYSDSRRHRRSTRRLQESESRLRTILDTSPLALSINLVSTQVITYANPRWCELYGVPQGQGVGMDCSALYAEAQDCRDLTKLGLAASYVPQYEARMRRPDGSEFWALLSAAMIEFDDQPALCISATDISKRKEHESLLAQAKRQAEETSHAKSLFLATMSHEIRTPMNGVMTMANLLQDMPMSSEQREMARIIYDSSNALLGIINDILDFSKIEAGRLHLETVEFSLLDVVEGVAELLAPRALDKRISLISEVDPDLPDRLLGDPVRLRQILTNLAGNAVKFTETGHVRMIVTPESCDDGRFCLRIAVQDTGIGLDDEQQSRLFAPFSQADASIARRYGGTGLGLSISQRLVEMMGGRMGVSSILGEGSTFWFTVPLTVAARQNPPAWDLSGVAVLLVSDNHVLADSIQPVLQRSGAQLAVSAGDDGGLAAIRAAALAGWRYDLLLLDCGHDWSRGLDAALTLSSVVGADQVISLLLPAPHLSSAAPEIRKSGLFAPLTQPIRRSSLLRLAAAAAGRAPADELEGAAGSGQEVYAPPTIEEAATADALILVAEDNPTNQAVIRRLMHRLGFAVEIAANGQEAWERMQVRDYGLLFTDCHMPGMDGYELTARIRAVELDGQHRTPIVALTADVLSSTANRCHDAGMDGILSKPIDLGELESTIRRLLPVALTLRRRLDVVDDVVAGGGGACPDSPSTLILDLTPIRLIFGTVTDDAKELLNLFVSSTRPLVDEISRAVLAGQLADAAEAAHGAKGAANSAGCYQFAHLCADMESCCFADQAEQARAILAALLSAFDQAAQAIAEL